MGSPPNRFIAVHVGRLLLLAVVLIGLTGCGDLLYFSKMGWHQGRVNYSSVPVEEVLDDGSRSVEAKEKVRFIQEVKRYGEERMGLEKTKNYTTFFELKGPILYVLTACPKDRLQLYSWNFPIIGRVTYKSYFTREDALKEKRDLDQKGYDTFAQQAGAYSTLGWLRDPILSTMLEWDHASLANLILHEMTHTTIYVKGETAFNEQVATFIGSRGAIDFLAEKFGRDSKEVEQASRAQEDDLLFAHWIDQAHRQLSEFYSRGIPQEEKLRGREEIFRSLTEELKTLQTRFKSREYSSLDRVTFNNAVLLAYQRYVHRLESFEPLYEYIGRDLARMVQVFKEVQSSGENPSSYLEQWMTERGINAPVSPR